MCWVAAIPMAMMAVSGLQQASAQRQAGKEAKAEAEYRAAIDRNNALRAEYLAEDAIERGKQEEREERIRGRLLIGQMRAVLAANGADVNSGSALDLQIDQAETNELEAQTVRNNAQREAQEFRIRASNYESEASLTQLAGENAYNSSKRKARGTLLSTAGKVAGSWYSSYSAGAFG